MPAVAKTYTKDLTKDAPKKSYKVTIDLEDTYGYWASAKTLGEQVANSYGFLEDATLRKIHVEDVTPTK